MAARGFLEVELFYFRLHLSASLTSGWGLGTKYTPESRRGTEKLWGLRILNETVTTPTQRSTVSHHLGDVWQ